MSCSIRKQRSRGGLESQGGAGKLCAAGEAEGGNDDGDWDGDGDEDWDRDGDEDWDGDGDEDRDGDEDMEPQRPPEKRQRTEEHERVGPMRRRRPNDEDDEMDQDQDQDQADEKGGMAAPKSQFKMEWAAFERDMQRLPRHRPSSHGWAAPPGEDGAEAEGAAAAADPQEAYARATIAAEPELVPKFEGLPVSDGRGNMLELRSAERMAVGLQASGMRGLVLWEKMLRMLQKGDHLSSDLEPAQSRNRGNTSCDGDVWPCGDRLANGVSTSARLRGYGGSVVIRRVTAGLSTVPSTWPSRAATAWVWCLYYGPIPTVRYGHGTQPYFHPALQVSLEYELSGVGGSIPTPVEVKVYPLYFLHTVGNIEATGLPNCFYPLLTQVNKTIHNLLHSKNNYDNDEDEDNENNPNPHILGLSRDLTVFPVSSQHSSVTLALSGAFSQSEEDGHIANERQDYCNNSLPSERISLDDCPTHCCTEFVYAVDVQKIKSPSGMSNFEHAILSLARALDETEICGTMESNRLVFKHTT
ncbi:hypothetical protein BC826DRAFT_1134913 [Russula brevipes]|nr:hypothetical protein BC826DRAFT_1134913 [Russula brevipes]